MSQKSGNFRKILKKPESGIRKQVKAKSLEFSLPIKKKGVSLSGVRAPINQVGRQVVKTQSQSSSKGIVDDVISTGMSIGKTLSGLAEGNPASLLEIPNSVMKVIDTSKNIIRAVQNSDATQKVVLEDKKNIKTVQDTVLIDKLQDNMPVITTTQLPTSYSTEVGYPELTETKSSYNGIETSVYSGSYMSGPMENDIVQSFRIGWCGRLTPINSTLFGDRLATIAVLYQKYRMTSFNAQFIPTRGTDFAGNVALNCVFGTDIVNAFPPTSGTLFQAISQRSFKAFGTLKQGCNLSFNSATPWRYVYDSTPGDPLKFFSDMMFGSQSYNMLPGGGSTSIVGNILFSFKFEFMGQVESGLSYADIMRKYLRHSWVCDSNFGKYEQHVSALWNIGKRIIISSSNRTEETPEETPAEYLSDHVLDVGDTTFSVRSRENNNRSSLKIYRHGPLVVAQEVYENFKSNNYEWHIFCQDTNKILDESCYTYRSQSLEIGKGSRVDPYGSSQYRKIYERFFIYLLSFFSGSKGFLQNLKNESFVHRLIAEICMTEWRTIYPIEQKFDVDPVESDEESSDDEIDNEFVAVENTK